MTENLTRLTLGQIRKLKSLSNARKFNETTDEEISQQIALVADLYELTDSELAEFELVRIKHEK